MYKITKIAIRNNFLFLFILGNIVLSFFFFLLPSSKTFVYSDITESNGLLFASRYSTSELFMTSYRTDFNKSPHNNDHQIIALRDKEIVWQYDENLAYPHGLYYTSNQSLLLCDCGNNRIIEIAYPSKIILRIWNLANLNRTLFQLLFNYSLPNPIPFDYAHLNDLDIKNYSTWTGILVSLRNLNVVLELNWTAFEIKEETQITWFYGNPQNTSMLNHQHSPKYVNNTIGIADSKNSRILLLNYSTKEIIWEYAENLHWVRDFEFISENEILITDSDQIIVYNKATKQISFQLQENLIAPYHAKIIGTNILVANQFAGNIMVFDITGKLVWNYGISTPFYFFLFNSSLSIAFIIIILVFLKLTKKSAFVFSLILISILLIQLNFRLISNIFLNCLFLKTNLV